MQAPARQLRGHFQRRNHQNTRGKRGHHHTHSVLAQRRRLQDLPAFPPLGGEKIAGKTRRGPCTKIRQAENPKPQSKR